MSGTYDFLSSVGETYLNYQVFVNNGELINLLSNDMNQMSYIITYVKQLMFNSSRYIPINENGTYNFYNLTTTDNPILVGSIFYIIWLCTFIIILLFVLIMIIFQCHNENKLKAFQKTGKIIFISSKTNSRNQMVKKTWKKPATIVAYLLIACGMVSLCFLCAAQIVMNKRFTKNDSVPSNNSDNNNTNKNNNNSSEDIMYSVNLIFVLLNKLYDVLAIDCLNMINDAVTNLNVVIKKEIESSISLFSKTILRLFYVRNIFDDANQLLRSLNIVIESMRYIKDNYPSTIDNISQTKGAVSVYQSQIEKNLQIICSNLNLNLQSECDSLKTSNQQFKTLTDVTKIKTDSSVIMLFILEQYSINITNITKSYQVVNDSFNNKLNTIFDSAVKSINVTGYLSFLPNFWVSTIIPMTSQIFKSFSSYKSNINSSLVTYLSLENIILLTFICFTFVLIIFISIYLYRATLHNKHCNKYLVSPILFFFVLFTFIFSIFAILLFTISNYLNVQICGQFNTTEGIELSDQLVNNKLKVPWTTLTNSLLNKTSGISITLMQPTNIVSAISSKCRNDSIGLLYAVGMKDFVNVNEILRTGGITEKLSETQTNSYKAFISVNPSQVIPADIQLFLNQSQFITQYMDGLNYTETINQLSIPLLGIENFVGYFNSLVTFVQKVKNKLGNTDEVIMLNDVVTRLNSNVLNFHKVQSQVDLLKVQYEHLQFYRNNTVLVKALLNDIRISSNIFANSSYVAITFNSTFSEHIVKNLMNKINQILNNDLTSLTNKLMPCGNLTLMMDSVTALLCSSRSIKNNFAGLAIYSTIAAVICQTISIMTIIYVIMFSQFPENESKC